MNEEPRAIEAVPLRHPWRWVTAALIAVVVANAIWSIATEAQIEWSIIGKYLFSEPILNGMQMTLLLTAIAMVMGVLLGIVFAVMWLSPNPVASSVAWFYIWVFRGTPVLVQLLFWGFLGAIYPHLSIGVPFGGPEFYGNEANYLIPPFVAAIFGLGFNEGAYMAEIVRGGISSVDEGQEEAASALGMSRLMTIRRIILPQAMRVIIPPTGNETISMLKTTSLVIVIPVSDLLYQAQLIYARNYKTIELLIVASLWYLFFTSILTIVQYYIERHYSRGTRRDQPPSRLEFFVKNFFPRRAPRDEGS
ncbi:MAG: amino acid ABC transporter permease [Thermoleophilaceae bacterium]|nr:amino acid ABC transporter permease [Thermoleophilaceae bacterium]